MDHNKITYSVIIPTLNEESLIERTIQRILYISTNIEIIVVDGGSIDETVPLARNLGAEVLHSERGRGIQFNVGARKAAGEVLLFLHADTLLPGNTFEILSLYFLNIDLEIGTFRLSFDEESFWLRFYSAFTKYDSIFTRFGDQCIVVRKSFLQEIGGFPDWPLFEDVHLLRMARRFTKIVSFPAFVITSARRFHQLGVVRTQLMNAWLFLLYFLGTSPKTLAARYANMLRKRHSFSLPSAISPKLRNL